MNTILLVIARAGSRSLDVQGNHPKLELIRINMVLILLMQLKCLRVHQNMWLIVRTVIVPL